MKKSVKFINMGNRIWKLLKMHLKLDKFITKNVNGIRIQIYI